MVENVAEHDEYRVVVERLVNGGPLPFLGRELFEPFDERGSLAGVPVQAFLEIYVEQCACFVLGRIFDRLNVRFRYRQDQIEPLAKQRIRL